MMQNIFNAAGTRFFLDPEGPESQVGNFVELTQDDSGANQFNRAPVDLAAWYAEGFTRVLRHGLSSFVAMTGQLVAGPLGGAAGPVVLDVGPLLMKNGVGGGIPGGDRCIIGGAGGTCGGEPLQAAHWALVNGGSSPLVLVDHDGTEITSEIVEHDQIGWSLNFVAVND